MMRRLLPICCLLLALPAAAEGPVPGIRPAGPLTLTGAVIHPMSGPPIPEGVLVMEKGRIVAVGPAGTVQPRGEVVPAEGLHCYPGLIAAGTTLGLTEIDQVRATRDDVETGDFHPEVKAATAFHPDSELLPVTRLSGVLLVLSVPRGGILSGRASLMRLDGWTREDMAVREEAGLVLRWPRMAPFRGKKKAEREKVRLRRLRALEEIFTRARAWGGLPAAERRGDLRLESLQAALEGREPVLLEADGAEAIRQGLAFCLSWGLRPVVVGGAEVDQALDLLKAAHGAVILRPGLGLPLRRDDPYDRRFTLPARLKREGIPFAIAASESPFEAPHQRSLPFHAAAAAAFGLDREDAVRSITLWPARILGVEDRLGSLEPGKEATLFLADGDILQPATRVVQAWVAGAEIRLESKQERLYRKYRERLQRHVGEP